VETLRPLVSKEGAITANKSGNSLVIVDYADNMARIRALVAQIDRDNASTQTILLEHAGAREIATALTQLIPAGGEGGRALATVVAVDSANAVLMRGERDTLARLAAMARQLDAKAATGGEIKVLWLDYADAAVLVPVLERLVGGQGGAEVASGSQAPVSLGGVGSSQTSNAGTLGGTTPQHDGAGAAASTGAGSGSKASVNPTGATAGGLGSGAIKLANGRGTATITRYPGANAIIIAAPADDQRRLTELVRQLDIPQEQVLVEAIIVEISNDVARELGVQFLFGGKDKPFAVTNFGNSSPNIIDVAGGLLANKLDQTTTVVNGSTVTTTTNSTAGDLLKQNAASKILAASGGYSGFLTQLGNNTYLGALINAVATDKNFQHPVHAAHHHQQQRPRLDPVRQGNPGGDGRGAVFRQLQQHLPHHLAPERGHRTGRDAADQRGRPGAAGPAAGSQLDRGHGFQPVGRHHRQQARDQDHGDRGRSRDRGARRAARRQRAAHLAEGAVAG
jgi:general secretion pathway protein D